MQNNLQSFPDNRGSMQWQYVRLSSNLYLNAMTCNLLHTRKKGGKLIILEYDSVVWNKIGYCVSLQSLLTSCLMANGSL